MSNIHSSPATTRVAVAPARSVSANEAAGFVTSGMWLDYGTSLCQPDVFDRALAARITDLTNVKIRHCLTMRPRAVHERDHTGRHVHSFSLHFAPTDRRMHDAGRRLPLPGWTHHRHEEATRPGQDRVYVRTGITRSLRHARPESRHALLSGRLHQRELHRVVVWRIARRTRFAPHSSIPPGGAVDRARAVLSVTSPELPETDRRGDRHRLTRGWNQRSRHLAIHIRSVAVRRHGSAPA